VAGKKEETTWIGNVNSGENPKRFNVKKTRKRDKISTQSYLALGFLCKAKRLRKLLLKWLYKDGVLCLIFQRYELILIEEVTGTSYNGRNSLFPARGV